MQPVTASAMVQDMNNKSNWESWTRGEWAAYIENVAKEHDVSKDELEKIVTARASEQKRLKITPDDFLSVARELRQ